VKVYKIMEKKWLWFGISLTIIALGIISLVMYGGLNWGIDFTGGTILQYSVHQPYNLEEVRGILSTFNLKDFDVKKAGDNKQELIVRTVYLTNKQVGDITGALKQKWPQMELERADKVDAVIGRELQRQAIIALIIANIGMLIYITFRFEFKSAVAAIIALIHDVLILISLFAIFQIPVDSTFVAALLTIVGYSINDTIVVFDRIRENLKLMRKTSFNEVANLSIVQTMARSINTSLTTLITIVALFLFGGETIKNFTLALIVGITSGTYSSIFIASPIWSMWREKPKPLKA
jgi:preprotein translocase subunit SecF